MASKEVTQIFLIKRFRPSINHLVEAETCRRTLVFDTSNAMILRFQGCFKYFSPKDHGFHQNHLQALGYSNRGCPTWILRTAEPSRWHWRISGHHHWCSLWSTPISRSRLSRTPRFSVVPPHYNNHDRWLTCSQQSCWVVCPCMQFQIRKSVAFLIMPINVSPGLINLRLFNWGGTIQISELSLPIWEAHPNWATIVY